MTRPWLRANEQISSALDRARQETERTVMALVEITRRLDRVTEEQEELRRSLQPLPDEDPLRSVPEERRYSNGHA